MEVKDEKIPIVLNKGTLIPIGAALFIAAIAIHFTTVKSLAEANKEAIIKNSLRTEEALNETMVSRRRIFDRLNRLEGTIGRIEGKLDVFLKNAK